MTDTLLLDIRGLTIDLPGGGDRAHAVEDLDLSLRRNEVVCIVGESGSGKSMTARAVMGLLPQPRVRASGGQILFLGEDLLLASPARMRALRGNRIAMIFQEPMTALNPLKTIGSQLQEAFEIHTRLPAAQRLARARELLDAVHLPDPPRVLGAYPHQLSGGQRQRVMIAMALAMEPDILIADEPTTALDVTTQAQIIALLKEIQSQRGMGILFVTHDFGVVQDIADRVAVMRHGRLLEGGGRERILRQPRDPYTRLLMEAIPSLVPPPPRALDRRVVLTVQDLCKAYGRRPAWRGRPAAAVNAVDQVGFTLRAGEIVGLVGESGSGKSTVARCVARLVDADGGRIALKGHDLTLLSRVALRPYRKRVQMVFQDPYGSLNPRRTVGALIAEGPYVHGMSMPAAYQRARELLQVVGLPADCAERYPHEFSGGQRQRIGIARALALEPEVLIADEPVSALDVSVQAQILALLRDIRDRLNLSMLFITHDLRVAAQLCDTIAVMYRGRIVECGPTAEVYAQPRHGYTKTLFAAVPGAGRAAGASAVSGGGT